MLNISQDPLTVLSTGQLSIIPQAQFKYIVREGQLDTYAYMPRVICKQGAKADLQIHISDKTF